MRGPSIWIQLELRVLGKFKDVFSCELQLMPSIFRPDDLLLPETLGLPEVTIPFDLISTNDDSQISWDLNEKSLHTSQATISHSSSRGGLGGLSVLDLPSDHSLSGVSPLGFTGDDLYGLRTSDQALNNALNDDNFVLPAGDLDIDEEGNIIDRPPQTPALQLSRVGILSDGASSQVRRDHENAGPGLNPPVSFSSEYLQRLVTDLWID